MAYEQSIPEHNLTMPRRALDLIGRRQALCTFAGAATALAGFALIGVGTAQAAEPETGHEGGETVTAAEVAQSIEEQAALAREAALVNALIPADLDVGKWSIEQVHPSRFGAIAVVMRTPEGAAFQVDVLRRDPSAGPNQAGVADTKHFSLFIANSGDGSKTSDEWQARGAKVLAHHILRTERSGSPLPQLMSFSERSSQHPMGCYCVLG
jgi:hypothetical protein